MRGYRAAIATALVATATLIACGNPGPNVLRGPVVGKEYDDPDSWITSYCTQYMKVGDVSICIAEHTDHHEDGPHWKFQLECVVGDATRRSWVEVTQAEYDSFGPRDDYPDEGPCLTDAKDGEME